MSFLWTTVFLFLCVEVFLTFVLCLPLPKVVQKGMAKLVFDFKLVKKTTIAFQFIVVGLAIAVWDSIMTIQRLQEKIKSDERAETGVGYVYDSLDRQRLFRSQRNLYLAGFSLTLLFAIRRILELMRDQLKHEEEAAEYKKDLFKIIATTTPTDAPPSAQTIEDQSASENSSNTRAPITPDGLRQRK